MDTLKVFKSLPEEIQEVLKASGIDNLYPPQAEAVTNGLLEDKNIVLSMPTAAGKTLLAELVMLKTLLDKKGNCLYIVPLRALASEKFEDFRKKFASLGIKVGIATGDFDRVDPYLTKNDILIATAEKVDSLLRQKPDWLCSRLACVVIDEIHYIGDPKRGPTLETVITRLLNMNPDLKLVGLSATIANANDISGWLNASLVSSIWRPVSLKEGVYCEGEITFADGSRKQIDFEHTSDDVAALAIDCIKDTGQVLVFVTTRRSAQAEARRISKEVQHILTTKEKTKLNDLAKEIETSAGETTKVSKQLGEYLKNGVVFHHAGLHYSHRKIIEDSFRQNLIKVICATPTLAVGVNLPSRRTIIRGLYRYVSGVGMRPVRVMEYKQMSGRAGRPGYDKFGESVLFARNKSEQQDLFSDFIFADSEPIHSHLGNESALRVHLLASIVTGFITSEESAFEFIKKTFFSYQEKYYDLSDMILEILEFLESEDMIQKKASQLLPTAFGTRISRLYIDPISAVILRDCLKDAPTALHPTTLLYLICSIPDMCKLALKKQDIEKLVPFADKHADLFELPLPLDDDYSSQLAKIKTVLLLMQWMEEVKEDTICTSFGIGPGDVHRFVETAEWLFYATIELSKLFKTPTIEKLHNIRTQLRYGIKSELMDLVRLKGIGRTRARNLFSAGFKNMQKLQTAPLQKLQKVPTIGKEIAANIKKQAVAL
ncbi:MAG: DEAD/DEAH box helicase [PVC group bacterium]|nr:DEAD/DEAH box helicase [PVC group bacterium]